MNVQSRNDEVARVHRQLAQIWIDFESSLAKVPIVEKLKRGKLRPEDYRRLLVNLRQQVIDGSRWIARAASYIESDHEELRSLFTSHAAAEHRDYRLLEQDYIAAGGRLDDIRNAPKNIGSEALSAWMFHAASRPNPFGLLGAMFIIEGLGRRLAGPWGEAIARQLGLTSGAISFFTYHATGDESHIAMFDHALELAVTSREVADSIVKHAKVTARLYRLQLEEIDNV